jgi:hypothetical protein
MRLRLRMMIVMSLRLRMMIVMSLRLRMMTRERRMRLSM